MALCTGYGARKQDRIIHNKTDKIRLAGKFLLFE